MPPAKRFSITLLRERDKTANPQPISAGTEKLTTTKGTKAREGKRVPLGSSTAL